MNKQQILEMAKTDPRFSQAVLTLENQIGDMPITGENLDELVEMLEFALNNPDQYPQIVAAAVSDVIPTDDIDVEFFIVKRKIWEESEFPQKRIQQFVPANGKTKVKKAKTALDTFINEVFNLDGSYKSTDFQATPAKHNCTYCSYKNKKELCDKAILK